ncbi:hypothetical protein FISHEDRAFT_19646, partial [Fistulina hepatica ATCC 64428]
RASSTSLRSPMTIHTIGRRRSGSLTLPLDVPPSPRCLSPISPIFIPVPEPHRKPSIPLPQSLPSHGITSFSSFFDRFADWIHSGHKFDWSTPSSPRSSHSSEDGHILPMSASSQKFSFTAEEKAMKETSESLLWSLGIPSIHTSILVVLMLFPVTTALVLFAMSTLPATSTWPQTLADLAQLGKELHAYSQSDLKALAHVFSVVSVTAVWMHAWSIPGSVLWNVLAGALFSPFVATALLTILTTLGSICATLLATPLSPILAYLAPDLLNKARVALEGSTSFNQADDNVRTSSPAWVRLAVLRLVGVVPWSGINIACGACGVSLTDCLLGSFIGSLPWTAVTCQIGDLLQSFAMSSSVAVSPLEPPQTVASLLTTPKMIFKLIFLSFLSLAPILARDRLGQLVALRTESSKSDDDALAWSAKWRRIISQWTPGQLDRWRSMLPGRLASRDRREMELHTLVDEKRRLQE